MSQFTTPLRVELCTDRREWKLLYPLEWVDPHGNRVIVPPNFVTDFASIPRVMRPFALDDSRTAKAATLHDWHYRVRRPGRRWADDVFYHALRSDGVHWLPAWSYWLGVRLFGWLAYRR